MNAPARGLIEGVIETLVLLLDTIDGDPDFEDDDPAGDPLDRGEHDGTSDLMPMPIWGIDQSLGPVNVAEADYYYSAAGGGGFGDLR